MSGSIQYLSNDKIDKVKWDQCIDKAGNGLIYAYSFYLDCMAKNWDALVFGDYEAVMPLTWNKKYGIRYLYQPFLTAQLGVFGNGITEELRGNFFDAIPSSFKYIDISLNSGNMLGAPARFSSKRSNFLLNLNKPYKELFDTYSENIQRNIKKALQAGCKIQKGFDITKVIELALKQMKSHSKGSADNVNRFRSLYQLLVSQKKAITYGVSLKDELLASAVFFFSHKRAYYILVGNNPNGKNIGASHALIDAFIKDHANRDLILDFEGSDIPGLASFYRSFGAEHDPYPALKINRLPFYLKWLKGS